MQFKKLKEKIRGTKYPFIAELHQWSKIRKDAKQKHPVRYWIAEDLFNYINAIVTWPAEKLRNTRCYYRNRFVTKTHVLGLNTKNHLGNKPKWKKGEWVEYDDRLLYAVMDSFVTWLKDELVPNHMAWNNQITGSDDEKIRQVLKEKQEFEDQPENWIEVYKTCLEIYDWWIDFDPESVYNESPWHKNCREMDAKYGDMFDRNPKEISPEDQASRTNALKTHTELEQQQEDKITEMLCKLMKIRRYLWT